MKIEFLGVGEAFEPKLGNASYILHGDTKLLVDCGYGVPRNLFEKNYSSDYIDALYITHFHADHTFGIPAVLNYWNIKGRTKEFTIIGRAGTKDYITDLIELGYSKTLSRLKYTLNFIETTKSVVFNELNLTFAPTKHSIPNYAIAVSSGGKKIGFSGDGSLTEASKTLFHDCHILIHESFCFDKAFNGHTTALEVLAFAKSMPNLKTLALVHIQRDERINFADKLDELIQNKHFKTIIPKPGDFI